jgi:diguanylate cyclase (GGDEF)-like protein
VSTPMCIPAIIAAIVATVAVTQHLMRRGPAPLRRSAPPAAADVGRRDRLTGLGNRAGFHQAMTAAGQHRQVVVILLNLDGSKAFTARFGDRGFDQLLVLIAGRARHVVTTVGGSLFRLRRDEFGVVVTDAVDARDLAARLIDAITKPTELDVSGQASTVTVTACAGVTTFAAGVSGDARLALVQADTAMRSAKRAGRGRIAVFTPPTPPGSASMPPPDCGGADGGGTR